MREKCKVKATDVRKGMMIAETIYAPGSGSMLIARKDTAVDDKIIERIEQYEVPWIEVVVPREPGTGTLLRGVTIEPLPADRSEETTEETTPTLEKDLRTEAIAAIRDLFTALQKPGSDVNFSTSYHVVRQFEDVLHRIQSVVTRDISGLMHLQDLKNPADMPYHHSLSVAVLAIATGQALGFDATRQFKLARCAILHDVGIPYVPPKIKDKKGKLNEEEYLIMKEHPVNGANNLKNKGFGDSELWNGVMFHHEKVDGSGYPKGLTGDEIPLFSRIIAVADTYDAVTSRRPHRDPMTPSRAFELISSEVGKSFDYEIVNAFTKNLVLYPVGIAVELSDSRLGIVINSENVLRPVVEIIGTGEAIDLARPENLSLAITWVVSSK